ncbi:cyclic di-GMP phosphodiesterase response regulator RpfG [Ruminiclostridium hungatei]|uniref:Cyclic di-GMP phosphodiesterase response regulator RpfG n=1 Tax=Ruminiclostridium hungatei TaxID=48256 RepID=A0A1V4SQ29_RUMHU|nr:HD-GYP domain-containing protein [Ruminiclostridium hungatei]OPX45972.1 cyclic di-GMP phosphodiesterase response regulator RpfG [Ruminiclostridium hungatei]
MTKLRVNVFDCRCGDVLAKDVISDKGLILAAENLVLNDFIISKLKTIGIQSVWIYKESGATYSYYEKKEKIAQEYRDTVLTVKNILNSIVAGKKLQYHDMRQIAEAIYNNIEGTDILIQHLNELKGYDDYTYSHCVNVGFYSMLIGKRLHMPDLKLIDLIQAGLLHDIGKIKIQSELLNKKEELTDEELGVIRKHAIWGYEILAESPNISSDIKEAALMHHERLDGSGYPLGSKGDDIGEYARIVAVADVYDAMTSDRPYKKKVTPFEAFNMFLTSGVCTFDTVVTQTFLLNFSTHLVGARVQLDNGQVGEIVYIPPHAIINPIVRVGSTFLKIAGNGSPRIAGFV